MVQNTSMKPKDVLELTIFELEDLFEGFAENNESDGESGKSEKPLEGKDAVNALKELGFLT